MTFYRILTIILSLVIIQNVEIFKKIPTNYYASGMIIISILYSKFLPNPSRFLTLFYAIWVRISWPLLKNIALNGI